MRASLDSTTSPLAGSRRWLRFVPALAWMGVIFVLSAQEQVPSPPGFRDLTSIAGHFTVYAILAALLWWAPGSTLPPRRRALFALGGAFLYALSDEWHQSFVPGRYPDGFDVIVDVIGAVVGVVAMRRLSRSGSTLARPFRT